MKRLLSPGLGQTLPPDMAHAQFNTTFIPAHSTEPLAKSQIEILPQKTGLNASKVSVLATAQKDPEEVLKLETVHNPGFSSLGQTVLHSCVLLELVYCI